MATTIENWTLPGTRSVATSRPRVLATALLDKTRESRSHLTTLRMPNGTGRSAPDQMIILLTASAFEEDRQRRFEVGIDDLSKPVRSE